MELPKRKQLRLQEYDYSQNGAYFVTICTHNKECILGDVVHNINIDETINVPPTVVHNTNIDETINIPPTMVHNTNIDETINIPPTVVHNTNIDETINIPLRTVIVTTNSII